jgi:predicted ATPase
VQDSAYSTLLRGPRQELHARIAQALVTQFPERVEVEPEVVANHFARAGFSGPAVEYWLRAGVRAAERSGNVEAVGHLICGLELLKDLPAASDERNRRELALRLAIGGPLIATKGYAAPETVEAYTRARELCEELGDTERLLPAVYGEWAARYVRSEVAEMRSLSARFSALADLDSRSGVALIGTRMEALDRFHSGELIAARALLGTILTRYDPLQHRALALQFGHDARAASLSYLTWTLWCLGYPEQAAATSEAAIAWAKELNHANSKGIALCWGGALATVLLRWPEAAEIRAVEVLTFCNEARLPLWGAYARVYLGWARVEQNDLKGGLAEMAAGLTDLRGTGSRRFLPLMLAWTAEAEAKAGLLKKAVRTIAEAFAALDATGDIVWMAELRRMRADLLSRGDRNDQMESENDLRQAIDVARVQQARSLELRASTSLARLWRDQGKTAEAQALLAPVYNWFTEGFDAPDLIEAKALLNELGAA